MKGNEQVVSVLNQVLRKELTGINQYFNPRQDVRELGLPQTQEGPMGRVDRGNESTRIRIIERILFLDGNAGMSPPMTNLSRLGRQQTFDYHLGC